MNARDDRFEHLLALAREGHIEAAYDLCTEYGFDAAPHLPTTEEPEPKTTHQEK